MGLIRARQIVLPGLQKNALSWLIHPGRSFFRGAVMVVGSKRTRGLVSAGFFTVVLVLVIAFNAGPAQSHPHVFIDAGLEVELDESGVKGLRLTWTFDEYFSAWIIHEYDADENGAFCEAEQRALFNEVFINLENYNFFTRILRDGRDIPVTVEQFAAAIARDRVVYSFFVPLGLVVGEREEPLYIAVYDESFYCEITFPPARIDYSGETDRWRVDYEVRKMPELTYYYGFVTPEAVMLSIGPS